MRFKCVAVICATFLVIGSATAQRADYTYEFSSVKLMESPNVNSYAEEIFPLYNRTFDTLFFVRSHHNENVGRDKINQDIWYTYKKDNIWTPARNFKAMNNAENNSIVGMGTKTETLYLLNSYTSTTVRNQGIAYTNFKEGEWTKPQTIDFQVNTGNNLYSFFINHTEDVILITMFNSLSEGEEDLFVSLKGDDGRWREPIYMGHEINSEGYETSPYLTDDKKTVFFTSSGFGGYGEGDIFMSKRLDDSWSSWSKPVNLGKDVNSDKFDGYFSMYENGEFLYASNKHSKFSDIFVGKWERKEIKPEAPVVAKVVEKPVEPVAAVIKEALPKSTDIYFDSNSSYFDQNIYQEELVKVAKYLANNPKVGLVVEGHTDNVGDETFNLILSLKRANRVSEYIQKQADGIGKDQVMVVPSGESKSSDDKDRSRKVTLRYILLNN